MYLVDKKNCLYSFLMMVSSILFIVFWYFAISYFANKEYITNIGIDFQKFASFLIVAICGGFFTLFYIYCEINLLRFLIKSKKEHELNKRYWWYFYLVVASYFLTALTSFVLFVISTKFLLQTLIKDSPEFNSKLEMIKKRKQEKLEEKQERKEEQ